MSAGSLKHSLLLLVFLSWAGCAGLSADLKQYGSFEPNREIEWAFETYQVNPNLNYYFSGSDGYPNAIMGLDKQYTLDEPLWKPVAMTPEKLRALVGGMQLKTHELNLYLRGWSMRDDKGREIGVWYSILFATTTVKVEEGNKVVVSRPDQNTYIKYEGGRDSNIP